ncbi:transcriptional attenuator, LytR family [Actinopolyspora mzabensis]|uniref:Transcriptional attenuator, LytR family n=1 Tax=Actinopolyspora mzabensis TaxID=995066 RepID=A0A1G9D283_ACTMZ|nr:LCP family protein [Actinopolyspora mzabensis]SDK58021.1 transcriptional attenuator, LytR family [Actinopolyspora mzabensis]
MDEPDTHATSSEGPRDEDAASGNAESDSTLPEDEPEDVSDTRGKAAASDTPPAVVSDGGRSTAGSRGSRVLRGTARVTMRSLLVLASVVTLAGTGLGWTALGVLEDRSNKVDLRIGDSPRQMPEDTATDILLVGSDSRTDAQGNPLPDEVLDMLRTESASGLNTDTIILLRVPDDGTASTAVSIPRDTAVRRSGEAEKINGIYGLTKTAREDELRATGDHTAAEIEKLSKRAGIRALVGAVESLTGVGVDHYAEVNLLGFYEVTKALGGVRVCLKRATSDKNSGAEFPAGEQTISGGDALAFVRQRHGLPNGDLDRIVRQQVFMAAVADKVLSSGTLTNTGKLRDLMTAARKSVVLDSDWRVLDFVRRMQSLASGDIGFVTIPVEDTTARNSAGRSVVSVDEERVHEFVAGFGHDVAEATSDSNSGSPGASSRPSPTGSRPGSPRSPAGSPQSPAGSPHSPAASAESRPGSTEPTHRMTGDPLVRLDGVRAASSAPVDSPKREITTEGIPCVY